MKISAKVKIALRSLLLKAGAVETEKGTLLYDAEEIEVGTEVYVENAEGEIVPAEDGEYVAGDTTYVVAEGKVTEVRKEETKEEENVEVESVEQEPEADSADEQDEPESEDASVEDRVKILEQALGEMREGIESLTNAIAALVSRIEEIENKMKGLEEPAAEPAEEGEEKEEKFTSKMSYLRKNKK